VKWEEHPVTFFKLTDYAWDEKRVMFEKNLSKVRVHTISKN